MPNASMNEPPKIFDRRAMQLRRARSGRIFHSHDFLHRRAMDDIVDRLESVKRAFPLAVFVGAGRLTDMLTPACGVGAIFHADLSPARLPAGRAGFAADEEDLPLAEGGVDLFVSVLTLHGANDLVGALAQARAALKPDGLFIAALFGAETLGNLRNALYKAETQSKGAASARVAPFASIQDCGQALARAGFALPVTDVDKVRVRYRSPINLVRDLRGMGETGALVNRPAPLPRIAAARAMEIFQEEGGEERFNIIYLTGWAPCESQQKPAKPGSAAMSLEAAVKSRQ
jgi:SAM-dependent methyltransferase